MNQETALILIRHADDLGAEFGSAGGGPAVLRQAIDALGVYANVSAAADEFARSFLHCHFDTGINLNMWRGAKEWLDTIFVDFDTITVPGNW